MQFYPDTMSGNFPILSRQIVRVKLQFDKHQMYLYIPMVGCTLGMSTLDGIVDAVDFIDDFNEVVTGTDGGEILYDEDNNEYQVSIPGEDTLLLEAEQMADAVVGLEIVLYEPKEGCVSHGATISN